MGLFNLKQELEKNTTSILSVIKEKMENQIKIMKVSTDTEIPSDEQAQIIKLINEKNGPVIVSFPDANSVSVINVDRMISSNTVEVDKGSEVEIVKDGLDYLVYYPFSISDVEIDESDIQSKYDAI